MRIYKVDIQILLCNLIFINANSAFFLPHATLESKFLDNLHGISMYIFKQNSVACRVYKILVKPSLCGSKKYCILCKWKLSWRPKTSVTDRGIKRNYFKNYFIIGPGTRLSVPYSLCLVACMHTNTWFLWSHIILLLHVPLTFFLLWILWM